MTSSYKYDVDGNRTFEGYVASGTYTDWYLNIVIPYSITHQNATVAWDAMNRMTSFTDTGTAAPATITWKYDKAGNVRNVNAVHRTLDAQGVVSTTTVTDDHWYKYDAMNRFTTTKGQLSGGVISRGLNGMDIGYDAAGQRTSMAKTLMTSVYEPFVGFTTYTWWERKELYTYTADGYLAQTNVAEGTASITYNDPTPPAVAAATGTGTQLAKMIRDAMGRVTTYTEYQPNGTTVAYSRAATYNSKSEASSDIVTVLRGADTWVYNTTYYYDHLGNGSGTYQGGVVTKQVVTITKNGVAQTGNNTTNTYVWWDGALQTGSTYVSGATTNTSTFYYNDSGYLQSVWKADASPVDALITVIGASIMTAEATMASSVDLGNRLEAFVDELVKTGRYNSRSEILREGVRLVHERETRLAALDISIARGLADADEGRVHDIDDVAALLDARYARRKSP